MNVPGTITVRTYYYGPTETNGSRMRAIAKLENGRTRQLTIAYPYAANNPDRYVAEQLTRALGYDVWRLVRMAPQAYVIDTTDHE
jgi:hypothetical protein